MAIKVRMDSKDVMFLAYSNRGIYNVRWGDVADAWLVEAGLVDGEDDPLIGTYDTLWEALDEMCARSNVSSDELVITEQP